MMNMQGKELYNRNCLIERPVQKCDILYKYVKYYHLRSTVKCERFFVHVYFSHETVFPDNCDVWTNENVSFAARNYECLFHSFVLQTKLL